MTLFIGNLNTTTGERDIHALFSKYGEVVQALLVIDRFTRRSRGYAYVQMTCREAGEKAIAGLNNSDFNGRSLVVNETRENGNR